MEKITNCDQFNYQLLARLQQDCDYYLGFGARNKKYLWALDEAEQIQKMKSLYNALPEKPVWISMADIERYEAAMLPKEAGAAGEFTETSASALLQSGVDDYCNQVCGGGNCGSGTLCQYGIDPQTHMPPT